MDAARPREHRVFAALYDRMTAPLEQGVLGERRGVDGNEGWPQYLARYAALPGQES